MNIITDTLYYILSAFDGWNSFDFILLALAFYLFYRWGYKKALEAPRQRPYTQISHQQVGVAGDDPYKIPPALRNK